MNYALLLAGGTGTRMGNIGIPKQFLTINDKPIIIYTLEVLLKCKMIDKVIIICNSDYFDYMKDLLDEYKCSNKVDMTIGGSTRLNSVLNGIKFIEEKYGLSDNDIFLAHDAVRMFVSNRIIEENIKYARIYGAATTVWPVEETIVRENSKNMLEEAFPRERFYMDQSPQAFNIKQFVESIDKISQNELASFTDLSEIIFYNKKYVFPIIGAKENIKITHQFDLLIAKHLIKNISNGEILENDIL